MTIEQRLAAALCGIVGVTIAGCAMGLKASREEPSRARVLDVDVVRAGRIEVFGSAGTPVVVLSENRDATGGVVFVNNDTGHLVAQMGAADDRRGVVWTYDRQGEPRDAFR